MKILLVMMSIWVQIPASAAKPALLKMSPRKMTFEEAEIYCRRQKSRVPEKEELDEMVFKKDSREFIWTRSRLFPIGPVAQVTYRLGRDSVYAPPLGKTYYVRCIK